MQRKTILYIALVVALGLPGLMRLVRARSTVPPFFPPGNAERDAAVGSTLDASLDLQAAFDHSSGSFSPIPEPRAGDWLDLISETGQTFSQYQNSDPNLPDQNRHTIYLQPLGDFPPDVAPNLQSLVEFASAFFDMQVKQLPNESIHDLPAKSRKRELGRQVFTADVLTWLKPRVPEDAYCLLAVTMTDLYPNPRWNFVFGQGSLKDRVGVYSFARYVPQPHGTHDTNSAEQLLLLRSCKILAHETGHMFGIKHCIHYHCLMNGSNGLPETDAAPIHLCPVCLRKLHAARSFDVDRRYRTLESLCEQFGWEVEKHWLASRIDSLQTAND